nr:MFS transporter [Micromonospora tarapacensis]
MTGPGQTATISAFVEPVSHDLHLGASLTSTAYLIGTLAGAVSMPWWGRLLDRYGTRRLILVLGVVFGAALLGASTVTDILGLTAAFTGLRMFGQGALSLAATTTVALYVTHRRGLALGIVSAAGATGISLAPLLVQHLIAAHGWRHVWMLEALAVWAIVIPVALLLPRHRKATEPHAARRHDTDSTPPPGLTLRQATRTPLFWAVAAGVCSTAMLATALNFHQIALLGERGFTPTQAAANFLPQTIAGLLVTPLAGSLVDRLPPRVMIASSMTLLILALIGARLVTPGLAGLAYGFAIGASMNSMHALEAASFPRYFGLAHIGGIRGFVHSLTVAGSAIGPLLLSLLRDTTGSYGTAALLVITIPTATIAFGLLVKPPRIHGQHLATPPVPDSSATGPSTTIP